MEVIKKRLRAIAWFLIVLILFQSCVVYHKTPTTLEKAAREQTKTKITNTNGDGFKYNYITYEDGMYYGVTRKSGEIVSTPLDQDYVAKVIIKNKSASKWATYAVLGIAVGVVVVGILSAESGIGDPGWEPYYTEVK